MNEQINPPDRQYLDVEEAIRKKNPRLLKLLPAFFIRYLKRIIHQDEMNKIIADDGDYYGVEFVDRCLNDLGIDYTVEGEENIPKEGRFIFISNHPLGGLDGMVLIELIGKHFKEVKFIVNDILMNIKNLESVFAPVNKHGKQSPLRL